MRSDPALWRRVLSAAVFLPILAWLIHTGGPWYAAFWALVLVFSLVEFCRMGAEPLPWWMCGLSLVALAAFCVEASGLAYPVARTSGVGRWPCMPGPLTLLVLGVLVAAVVQGGRPGTLARVGRAAVGLLYIGGLGCFMFDLRGWRPDVPLAGTVSAAAATGLAYVLTWTADTGAYAVGLAIGRRPLAPRISPGKTWEGALGGLAASVLAGVVAGATVWKFLGPGHGAVLGLLVGVAGQMGDLIESMLKRELGAKDSATWIPGHGGVLDRFDSLLASTPVVFFYLSHLLQVPRR